jgi:dienelactone hydrolase
MEDELATVRWAGLQGLGKADPMALLLPLWHFMNDPDPFLRTYAARVLDEKDERRASMEECGLDRSFGPPQGYGMIRHSYRCEALDSEETCPLYVPPLYSHAQPWPLIVVLAGGSGDGEDYIGDWLPNLATRGYFAVAPVGQGRFWWQEGHHLILSAIESVKRAYNIDDDRVYVTGMSNGGLGTYFMTTRFPGLFAAGCSIAGNPVNENTEDDDPAFLLNLVNVPISLIHGALDNVIPVEADRTMKARMDSLGYWIEYLEHEDIGHDMLYDSTDLNLDHEEALSLFNYVKRLPYPAEVNCVADTVRELGYYWVRPDSIVPGAIARLNVAHDLENEIQVIAEDVKVFTLFFNDDIIDFERPVRVVVNEETIFHDLVDRDLSLCSVLCEERVDWGAHFYGTVTIRLR